MFNTVTDRNSVGHNVTNDSSQTQMSTVHDKMLNVMFIFSIEGEHLANPDDSPLFRLAFLRYSFTPRLR